MAVAVGVAEGEAHAGVEAWRINEVGAGVGGDPELRFVELYAPPSPSADSCFFSSTRLEVLAADGTLVGSVTPFGTTTCFAGDTYFLFATTAAATHYGVARDAALPYPLPAGGGQVCFRSSATRYDCVRWGAITFPVTDLGDPSDTTSAPAIPDGQALARVATTNVVAMDFVIQSPTPRQPNDGTVWYPPDAGPTPDGSPLPDADLADARMFPDARPRPDADTSGPPTWTAADPGGGGCAVATAAGPGGRRGGGGAAIAIGLLGALGLLRAAPRRRRCRR